MSPGNHNRITCGSKFSALKQSRPLISNFFIDSFTYFFDGAEEDISLIFVSVT